MVFLLCAVIFLMNNRLTFMPMNHIGRNIKGLALKKNAASSDQSDISAKAEEGR
jgi:hypothetical protein